MRARIWCSAPAPNYTVRDTSGKANTAEPSFKLFKTVVGTSGALLGAVRHVSKTPKGARHCPTLRALAHSSIKQW
eukprot:7676451-Alexandrium_andersonii.AAC.1